MLPTTVDAVKALLKADPSLTPADRSQIVAARHEHTKRWLRLPVNHPVERGRTREAVEPWRTAARSGAAGGYGTRVVL